MFLHEQRYRSPETMQRLQTLAVTICGAGALGGNISENLVRSGLGKLKVIDRDRVEAHNLSTQPYYRADVGAFKAKILANALYRAVGVTVEAVTKELTAANVASLLKGSDLVLDTFDNSVARQVVTDYCREAKLTCLHVGLAGDYAEVIWNPVYRVPAATNNDVCDYPLARNLVMLATAIACEVVFLFLTTQEQQNYTITLKDLTVKPLIL